MFKIIGSRTNVPLKSIIFKFIELIVRQFCLHVLSNDVNIAIVVKTDFETFSTYLSIVLQRNSVIKAVTKLKI